MDLIPAPQAAEGTKPSTETATTPPSDFDQLLQGLAQPQPPVESALPELLAVVASLAGASNLLQGLNLHAKEKKPPAAAPSSNDPTADPIATVEALRGIPQIFFQAPAPATPAAQPEAELPQTSTETTEALTSPIEELKKPEAPSKPLLNLKDFDVRRFEFKTQLEIATVRPKLIRIDVLPGVLAPQPKPSKSALSSVTNALVTTPTTLDKPPDAPLIAAPEAVERVRVAIEPPPPPAVVRQVSMDIGEAGSEVRVIIRERGGELAVQLGAANEELREDLQHAAPLLMHELRRDRDNASAITLDFSSFGSATDAGHDAQQDSPRKKPLKSEAVFAELDETAYLDGDTPSANSF